MGSKRLENQVAIITGGANGIGKAAVKRFLEEGAKVVVADYDEAAGNQLLTELNTSHAFFAQVDIGNRKSIQQMVQKAIDQFGTIDILVNNAGILRDATLAKMTEENFQEVLNVNLTGTFACTQEVAAHMSEKGSGKIINATSVSGIYGNFGQTNYAASKAAVVGMTKTWAKELGRKGINVNAVAPGFTRTAMVEAMPENVLKKMEAMVPLQRLATPEEIANAYLFLASDESSYVHGHVLHVDGAIMM